MSSILKAFNTHLIEFISDIITIFPERKSLRITRTALETWKRVNPRSIIKIWKESVTDRYKEQIANGEPVFFLEKDYVEDISGCENATYILAAIEKLREPIRQMGEENQKKAIKYIQNLTKLSELYYSSS